MPILAPPNEVCESLEIAESSICEFAKSAGFAVVRERSKPDKNGNVRKVWLMCDKSLTCASASSKRRTSGSRKTNCPFRAVIQRQQKTPDWYVTITDPNHNHEPSQNPEAHPAHRKRSAETKSTIKSLTDRKVKPRKILQTLQNQGVTITAKDIRNDIQEYKRQKITGETPIQVRDNDGSTLVVEIYQPENEIQTSTAIVEERATNSDSSINLQWQQPYHEHKQQQRSLSMAYTSTPSLRTPSVSGDLPYSPDIGQFPQGEALEGADEDESWDPRQKLAELSQLSALLIAKQAEFERKYEKLSEKKNDKVREESTFGSVID